MTMYQTITVHCDSENCNQKIIPHGSSTSEEAIEDIEKSNWTNVGLKSFCPVCSAEAIELMDAD